MTEAIIISTGGMVADWIGPHLASVERQTWRVPHVVCTPDEQAGRLARAYLDEHPNHETSLLEDRGCALANIYPLVHALPPQTVCLLLDADDWFACDDAVETVLREYEDPEVWMTWGQFRFYPGGGRGFSGPYPAEVVERGTYRTHDWLATHLKTFRAGLFQCVAERDMRDPATGEWLRECADLAIIWPMLEMARERGRYIDRVTYGYNVANETSVHNVHGEKLEQVRAITRRLRGMPRYSRLEVAPW